MARQTAEPGFHGVEAFADGGEAQPVDDPLDRADLFIDARAGRRPSRMTVVVR